MIEKPMRLGILAVLLLVIGISLTTLGVLTLSTAQADLRLAQRYAETTRAQYQREAAGQTFMQEVQNALAQGMDPMQLEGVTQNGDIFEKTIAGDSVALCIGFRVTEPGNYEIVRWETTTQWAPQEQTGNLWGG